MVVAKQFQFPETLPFDDPTPVKEQIGSQRKFVFRFRSPWDTFVDQNISDYKFWDKARRGKAKGLELSGLLLRALSSKITAWVLGDAPLWQTENQSSTRSINEWWQTWQPSFMRIYQESLDLGDSYAVFNGDGSITIVPPDRVDRILDPNDFQTLIGYRVTITYGEDNGSDAQTFVNEYYADHRVEKVTSFSGKVLLNQRFRNPLGKIPVVHIPNQFGSDELFGRPLGDPLLNLLIRYGDVFDAALKGNIRQGRPTPTINKMGTATQVDEFWERYGRTETVTLPDGTTEERMVIDFDPDLLLTLGGEAQFKYEAPGSFVQDTEKLLGLLFYLVVQHSEVAEFALGVAVSASKASTESQLDPFLRFIKKMRGLAMGWIQELVDLYSTYLSVYDRSARGSNATALWKPMSAAEGRLMLDSTIWMYAKKLMDPVLATWLNPLGITDPEIVADRAKDYWQDEYASTSTDSGTGVPASGGGNQEGQFNKQENPLQPTERQMKLDIPVQEIEPILIPSNINNSNGYREPVPV